MIPILFRPTDTVFTTNGLGRLSSAIACRVEEERNGAYELELEYPVTGAHFGEIGNGSIIVARHSDRLDVQPFRVYRITRPIDGRVTVYARHLSYDLNKIVVAPFSASSVADLFRDLPNHCINACPFTFETDKAVSADFVVTTPSSVRSILGGSEGSVLDVYGTGEYEFDGYNVKLWLHRGTDNGVTIRYGKNLSDIEQDTNSEDVYNGVAPYWKGTNEDGSDDVVTLTEGAVFVDGVTEELIAPLDLTDDFEEKPTEADLRAAAVEYLANNAQLVPTENINVSFVQLWQTNEYKDYAPLQRVGLCDTVTVIYTQLGISAKAEVIRTRYNVLLGRYDSIEIGEPRATLADTIIDTERAVKDVTSGVQSMIGAAVATATELIAGGLGGHVVINRNANGEPNEILIMDTDSISTAVNVLRLNMNGIGFSSSGYNGPFTTAWTIDSRFYADFITAGTLRAIMIQGPTASTFWDLTSGRWQSGGNQTVTADIGDGTDEQTTKTYSVDTITGIDDGVIEIYGAVDGGASQKLASIGVAGQGMGYTRYTNDLYNPERSDSFVYAGLDLLGSTVNGYASNDEGMAAYTPEATYRPHGTYSPDQLRLGEAEDLNAASSDYVADRNPLILTGGWTNAQDAIIFRRYYREHVEEVQQYAIPTASRYPRTVGGMTITKTSAGNGLYKYTIDGESPTEDTIIDYNMGMANATEATQCDSQEWLSDNGAPYWFITGSEFVELQECSRLASGGDIYTDYSLSYGLAEAVTDSPLGAMYNWVRLMVKAGAPLPIEITPQIYDSGLYGLVKSFYPTPIDVRPAWEYAPGDSVSGAQINLSALFTNSRKDLRFFLPLSRPISAAVDTIDFHCVLRSVYVNGTAVHNAAQNVPDDTNGYTLASVIPQPGGLTIWIRRTTAWSNGTNNAAAMIQLTSWSAEFLQGGT